MLWEEHLNKLAEGECYQISNVAMCSYNGSKYLSAGGYHATFEQVNDIGDVTDDVFDEENPVNRSEYEGEIDAVVSCTEYPCCKAGKAKVNAISRAPMQQMYNCTEVDEVVTELSPCFLGLLKISPKMLKEHL